MKIRRFLEWLVRPQFTAVTVAAWFALGNLAAFSLPQWVILAAAAGIGCGQVVIQELLRWFLRRHGHAA